MGYKMAVVVVKSTGMGPGKMAAQVGHACVSCTLTASRYDRRALDEWLEDGQKKVVLKVDTTKELYPLKVQAEDAGLTTALITDAGHTQLAPGTVTCLGIGPGKDDAVDAIVRHLKLY